MLVALALALAVVPQSGPVYVPPAMGPVIRHFEPPPGPYGPGHRGIDIAVPAGTVIRAAADGVVSFAGPVAGSLYVTVDHADGVKTTSSFLSEITVRRGQRIERRTPVGRSGRGHPGSTEPPHVHFGARRGEEYIDPEPLIVASMPRDYADYVRLAPDGKVFAPPAWMLLIPSRRSRSLNRKKSSLPSGGAKPARTGAFRASPVGRSVPSRATRRCC